MYKIKLEKIYVLVERNFMRSWSAILFTFFIGPKFVHLLVYWGGLFHYFITFFLFIYFFDYILLFGNCIEFYKIYIFLYLCFFFRFGVIWWLSFLSFYNIYYNIFELFGYESNISKVLIYKLLRYMQTFINIVIVCYILKLKVYIIILLYTTIMVYNMYRDIIYYKKLNYYKTLKGTDANFAIYANYKVLIFLEIPWIFIYIFFDGVIKDDKEIYNILYHFSSMYLVYKSLFTIDIFKEESEGLNGYVLFSFNKVKIHRYISRTGFFINNPEFMVTKRAIYFSFYILAMDLRAYFFFNWRAIIHSFITFLVFLYFYTNEILLITDESLVIYRLFITFLVYLYLSKFIYTIIKNYVGMKGIFGDTVEKNKYKKFYIGILLNFIHIVFNMLLVVYILDIKIIEFLIYMLIMSGYNFLMFLIEIFFKLILKKEIELPKIFIFTSYPWVYVLTILVSLYIGRYFLFRINNYKLSTYMRGVFAYIYQEKIFRVYYYSKGFVLPGPSIDINRIKNEYRLFKERMLHGNIDIFNCLYYVNALEVMLRLDRDLDMSYTMDLTKLNNVSAYLTRVVYYITRDEEKKVTVKVKLIMLILIWLVLFVGLMVLLVVIILILYICYFFKK